jgi:hypothetical protein
MRTHPEQMVWPDPIIGYREFVDRTCRAIFEDTTGQYVMADDGERITACIWSRQSTPPGRHS